MDKPNAWDLREQYPDGLELSYKNLCSLDMVISHNDQSNISKILDGLEGSKVKTFLVPYGPDDSPEFFVQLRYGEYRSEELFLDSLVTVQRLMPFIAACAGPLEEEVKPSQLERLEQRVDKLEREVFPELYGK